MRKEKKYTIKQKLGALSIIGILLSAAIGISGFYGIGQTDYAMDRITASALIMRTHLTADMMHDALKADVLQAILAGEHDMSQKAEVERNLHEHSATFREMIKKNEELITTPEIDKALIIMEKDLDKYIHSAENITRLSFIDVEPAAELEDEFLKTYDILAEGMEAVSDMIEADILRIQATGDRSVVNAKRLIVAISVIVFVFLGLASKKISGAIIAPINDLVSVSEQVGEGNLSVEIDTSGVDAVSQLARSFETMVGKLNATSTANAIELSRAKAMIDGSQANMIFANNDLVVEYMNPASLKSLKTIEHLLPVRAESVVGTCIDIFHKDPARVRKILGNEQNLPHKGKVQIGDQTLELIAVAIHDHEGNRIGQMATWSIDTAKQQMEVALRETSSSVSAASEELSASSQEMKEQSNLTNEAAKEALQVSVSTDQNVSTVATAAEEMKATVSEISKNVQEATQITNNAVIMSTEMNDKIGKLAESSREIGQVVKVINTIAGKTNLLALNATIEAARAGEAGKGFAVVASEVKDLANATANATDEIQTKIKAIQSSTIDSVEAIKKIGEIVEKTNEISTTIAGAVEEQAATTGEITRNMAEAAKNAKEVSDHIKNISTNAESLNEGTENVLTASVELSKMSGDLLNLVSDSDNPDGAKNTAASRNGEKTPVHA